MLLASSTSALLELGDTSLAVLTVVLTSAFILWHDLLRPSHKLRSSLARAFQRLAGDRS